MKLNVNAINETFDKLQKNVDAVGMQELEKGTRYKKAWEKAKEDYRELLKMYGYAKFCNGVVTVLEDDAMEDASRIALLASLRYFEGKFQMDGITGLLELLKVQFNSILESRIKELEDMSERFNAPIFIDQNL